MRTEDHSPVIGVTSARELAQRFATSLAAKDVVALRSMFASEVDFRGLTPGRVWEAHTLDALVDDVIFGSWFEPDDVIQGIETVQHGRVGTRFRIGYRLQVANAGGTFSVEQQAYCDVTDGKITWLRMLCSGFVPVAETGALAPADWIAQTEGAQS